MFTRHKSLSVIFWILFFSFIGYFSYQRAVAFGCFDDCARYVAAYFMLKGKILYAQIFDNHQMLTTYLSYLVQLVSHPATIYQLVLYHRAVVFLFGVCFDLFLIRRFGKTGVLFILLYEPAKFYLFGERFLSESFIVYPLVYLFGLKLEQLSNRTLKQSDLILAAVFTWFVIFMREPYILLALFLYGTILWGKFTKEKKMSIVVFILLLGLILASIPLKEYVYQVFEFNVKTNQEAAGVFPLGLIKSFFYPVLILFWGKTTLFRVILAGFDLVFLYLLIDQIKKKKAKMALFIFIALGLANFRFVAPGTQFYEAFHLIVWYGLFLFAIAKIINERFGSVLFVSCCLFFVVCLLSPKSYVWDRIDRNAEFVTGYGNYVSNGFVIKTLANANSTLFADRIDDLLYWISGVKPAYKYSWYFTGMPSVKQFSDAYNEMFAKYPPDFYLGFCPKETHQALYLPKEQFKNYVQIYFAGKPSCLYVRKTTVQNIPKEKIEEIGKYQYSLRN